MTTSAVMVVSLSKLNSTGVPWNSAKIARFYWKNPDRPRP
jgi:hypothetical protein